MTCPAKQNGENYVSPIYHVFPRFPHIGAVYTGRGTSPDNKYYSFSRPRKDDAETKLHFASNLSNLAKAAGLGPDQLVTLPNGAWPHSGASIKVEDYVWKGLEHCPGTVVPVDTEGNKIVYDAIATKSSQFAMAVQGADCQSVFLYDPVSGVIGAAHSGWKPLVLGVLANLVKDLVELGASPHQIHAFISPGVGDRYNCFRWDDEMEPEVRKVFEKAGREDLLEDQSLRHRVTDDDRTELGMVVKGVVTWETFMLSELATRQLVELGLGEGNISRTADSTLLTRYSRNLDKEPGAFKYHSYRRDGPNHGLSMSVIFLR